MRILVVEDEATLRQSLVASFTAAGFTVDEAADGEEGLFTALEYPLDAAIVDLGLPKLSGLDLIRQLRAKQRTVPVIILTARISWKTTVELLGAGADEYVHKPFEFEELLARVQALMRRSNGWTTGELTCGAISLHLRTHDVFVNGGSIPLTTFEYRVLEYLMLHAGEIVSKTELIERMYEEETQPEYNVVDVLIRRLRVKLDPEGRIQPIETVRGRGYRLGLRRGGV